MELSGVSNYCSLRRHQAIAIRTEQEGITAARRILSQWILCRHDVHSLNRIDEMLGRSNKSEEISTSQKKLHGLVTEKMKRLCELGKIASIISSENMITLHHMRGFVQLANPLTLTSTLQEGLRVVKSDDMAPSLPFCEPSSDFERDVEALLITPILQSVLDHCDVVFTGSDSETPDDTLHARTVLRRVEKEFVEPKLREEVRQLLGYSSGKIARVQAPPSPQISQLLDKLKATLSSDLFNSLINDVKSSLDAKKQRFVSFTQKPEKVQAAKTKLSQERQLSPGKFPSYLDELLNLQLLDLYTHLLEMKKLSKREERDAFARGMTFSLIAQVILEIKSAIVENVKKAIPEGCRNVLFLLGGTGSGKSTTLCFLRGDPMELKDFQYDSKVSGAKDGGIIGHSLSNSMTFFPNVSVVKGMAIVDFPGFEDSNGPIVSLGIECALKALVRMFYPKIMVLEAITNIDGRFAAAQKLAERLKRVLGNKENCILGITKYVKNPHFARFKELSKQKEGSPSEEETKIQAQIDVLTPLVSQIPGLQAQVTQLGKDLAQKMEERLKKEEAEKSQVKGKFEEIEKLMLKETGLQRCIPFYDLEDPNRLQKCLYQLNSIPLGDAGYNTYLVLDAEDERLLDGVFERDLVGSLERGGGFYKRFKNVEAFRRRVLETSIVSTMTEDTPEIGHLLHMPELDPNLVRKYDEKIVKRCIKELMEFVIVNLNVGTLEMMMGQLEKDVNPNLIKDIKTKLEDLRQYVQGLLGKEISSDPEKAKREWKKIEEEHASFRKKMEEKWEIPVWAKVGLCIPLGIPFGFYWLTKTLLLGAAERVKKREALEKYRDAIQDMKRMLIDLKELEGIIEKRKSIDSLFLSVPIHLISLDAVSQFVKERIEKVRSANGQKGQKEWDERVKSLSDLLSHAALPPKLSSSSAINNFKKLFFKMLNVKSVPERSSYENALIHCIVASFFDPSIQWVVLRKEETGRYQPFESYSWEHFYPMEMLRSQSLLDATPRRNKSLYEKKGMGTYQIVLKRKEEDALCLIREFEVTDDASTPLAYNLLNGLWESHFFPAISSSELGHSPFMLATMGDALLKQYTIV